MFDSDSNILVTPNSLEITVRSKEATDGVGSTPGTIRENSPEIFPRQKDRVTERIRILTCNLMRIRV